MAKRVGIFLVMDSGGLSRTHRQACGKLESLLGSKRSTRRTTTSGLDSQN